MFVIRRIANTGLEADAAKGAPHQLGVPEKIARHPRHHAHRVVPRLNQTLIEAVLLEVDMGL